MIIGRTPNNKIKILTNNPLGLRVVGCNCCNPCGWQTERNVFEITKEEYDILQLTNTWQLSYSFSNPYIYTLNGAYFLGQTSGQAQSDVSITKTEDMDAWNAGVIITGSGSWSAQNPTPFYFDMIVGARFAYNTCIKNAKYYVKFLASGGSFGGFTNNFSTDPSIYYPPSTVPAQFNLSANGNTLSGILFWRGLDSGDSVYNFTANLIAPPPP
jgi:hypothetical protein